MASNGGIPKVVPISGNPYQDVNIIVEKWGDDSSWHYLIETFIWGGDWVVLEDDAVVHSGQKYAAFITELTPSIPPAIPQDNYVSQYGMYIRTGGGSHPAAYYKSNGWFIESDLSNEYADILPYFKLSTNDMDYTFFY